MNIRITAPGNVSDAADRLEVALRELLPDYIIGITDPPTDEDGAVLWPNCLRVVAMYDAWKVVVPISFSMITGANIGTVAALYAERIEDHMRQRPRTTLTS